MKVLLTGGGGFLGSAIARRLRARGDEVHAIQRQHYPLLDELGVIQHQGDITNLAALGQAARGCDAIVHTAAKAGVWGSYASYHQPNVVGTQCVLQTCREQGIKTLVYTSSPSVVFSGRDEDGIDESAPYPTRYLTAYPQTKAQAEQLVLAANDDKLATTALRPHLIWGPGDPHLVPRVLARARAGRLRLLGKISKRVDSTYVDNAALAHVLALDRLHEAGARAACAGKAYFISNGQPLPMADLLNRILAAGGLPPVTRTVPAGLAYAVGALLETLGQLTGRTEEPIMTRFVARQLSTAHWYDLSAARRDLGYQPEVSLDEGFARLAAALAGG